MSVLDRTTIGLLIRVGDEQPHEIGAVDVPLSARLHGDVLAIRLDDRVLRRRLRRLFRVASKAIGRVPRVDG